MTGFNPRVTCHLYSPDTKAQQLVYSLVVWEDDRVQPSRNVPPVLTSATCTHQVQRLSSWCTRLWFGRMTGFNPRVTCHLYSPGTKAQQLVYSLVVWEDDRVQPSRDVPPVLTSTKAQQLVYSPVVWEDDMVQPSRDVPPVLTRYKGSAVGVLACSLGG
ncbi:hypothetical protein RRG08_000757 [Elysia crispata]|uniref:Uncharacterized protein n=1 Tax=Elysia crispata TaxID=231223 RepID=A0AAE0YKY8_9GAST|nr:hypothetical protein RRG08_000757 [Elysia crispata]